MPGVPGTTLPIKYCNNILLAGIPDPGIFFFTVRLYFIGIPLLSCFNQDA